jgi:uncharacterized protein
MPSIIGIISDTHGLMRPEAIAALYGSSVIIHAGDIGNESVLRTLEGIAPVYAVRGNNDTGDWAATIPIATRVTIAEISIHVLHDIGELNATLGTEPVHVVVTGHSHRPLTNAMAFSSLIQAVPALGALRYPYQSPNWRFAINGLPPRSLS